jgi:hypothetical protein
MLFRYENSFNGDVPYYDGSIESAVLSGNSITYYHHIPNNKDPSLHDRVIYANESYQDAQKTFENTPPLTIWEKITKNTKKIILIINNFLDLIFTVLVLVLLFMASTGSWLFIIPLIILFIMCRRCRTS